MPSEIKSGRAAGGSCQTARSGAFTGRRRIPIGKALRNRRQIGLSRIIPHASIAIHRSPEDDIIASLHTPEHAPGIDPACRPWVLRRNDQRTRCVDGTL